MKKHIPGFSLVELVVVVSILAILSSISFLSFSKYMVEARNSDRISDLGNMKISLRTSKQRTGAYPAPGSKVTLTFGGTTIGFQGWFNEVLGINTLSEIPNDPRVTKQYYAYATTATRQLFQLGAIIEGTDKTTALLEGDYKTVAKDILPSLLTSSTAASIELKSGVGAGDTNRKTFIINGGSYNLPYGLDGKPKTNTTATFETITSEAGTNILESSDYTDCRSLYEAGRSIGATTYRLSDGNGGLTSSGCTMNPPNY